MHSEKLGRMSRMEIKVITYEEERLLFFTEQMEKAKKRYERLNKTYQGKSYLSEVSQKLADAGRELRFYEDVVEMLKANELMKKLMEEKPNES